MTAEKNAFCTAYNSVFFVNLPRRFSFFAAFVFLLLVTIPSASGMASGDSSKGYAVGKVRRNKKREVRRRHKNEVSAHTLTDNIMENLALSLQLLVVGMLTVFAILLIVIYGSKALITIVNQIAPEGESSRKQKMAVQTAAAILPPEASTPQAASIDAATMEVLQQAVAQLTKGKGRILQATKV